MNRIFQLPMKYRKGAFNTGNDSILVGTVSPAVILRACLIALNVASYPGRQSNLLPCFVGSMPDTPDSLICLKDSSGRMLGRKSRTGKVIVHNGIVVTIRTPDYTGWVVGNTIKDSMDQNLFPFTVQVPEDGSNHYLQNVYRTTSLFSLGEEVGKKRQLWSFNACMAFDDREPSLG